MSHRSHLILASDMPDTAPAKPRKRPAQSRSRATVEAILDAAAHILLTQGIGAASTNRIAGKAGVSIGSLYQYFPNKTALIGALRRRHAESMRCTILQLAGPALTAPLPHAVRSMIHAVMQAHRIDPELHRILAQEAPRTDFADSRGDIDHDLRSAVGALLRARQSEILPTNPELAAAMLVRLVDALIHAAVIDNTLQATQAEVEEEIVRVVMRYLTGQAQ